MQNVWEYDMTDIVVKDDNKTEMKKKRRDWHSSERVNMREGEMLRAESVCLLTKQLKSMAVLMNISPEKLVPSSAGTASLTANMIEHHLKAAHDWKAHFIL